MDDMDYVEGEEADEIDDVKAEESDDDYIGTEESDYMDEGVDRLSELPNSLIFHIFSFMSMRDVIKTCYLSKRWENLWTTVPCLNFTDVIYEEDGEVDFRLDIFRDFVNRALVFWRGTRIQKFKIDICTDFDRSFCPDIDLWLRFALENEVEDLSLSLDDKAYKAPHCLYSCSSLRKLSLVGCNLRTLTPPAWNQIKILRIDSYYISDCTMNHIMLGTPKLEVLHLSFLKGEGNLNIQSTSLKKLRIEKDFGRVRGTLSIQCPNVEKFEIFGALYPNCLSMNVSSLSDASLSFTRPQFTQSESQVQKELLGETLRHIFSTIQHVETLKLSSFSIQVLGASQKQNLFLLLPNVTFLELHVGCCMEHSDMMNLVMIFPNLRMLVIEDRIFSEDCSKKYLNFETNLFNSSLLQLKTIQIASNFKNFTIFQLIYFLLKQSSMLEKLVIQLKLRSMKMLREQTYLAVVAETLQSMPRSSPNAKVIFNIKEL